MQTALVTGASRGLGRALALQLAARGVRVVLVARASAELTAVEADIRASGGHALAVPADVGDPADVERVAAQAGAWAGPLDLVVHAASTLGPVPMPLLLDLDPADFERVIAVNLVGPHRLSRALVGPMALRGSGAVVAISSDAAVEAYPTWGAYGATKAALDHLSRTFAAELADTGVRFLALDPGEMDTAMHAAALPDADPATLRRPEAVAAAILHLVDHPPAAVRGVVQLPGRAA